MSLVGNLEDLGLGDILQIVNLSRKSGVLSLESRGREGRIVFQGGQVVRAISSVFRENLGDLLLRKGHVDIETLRKALNIQKQHGRTERLGAILAGQCGVSRQVIEETARQQVEKIVFSFFGWDEGTFAFSLFETEGQAARGLDSLQFMLEEGLNPQWLALEGARLLDERRHRGEAMEEEPHEPLFDDGNLLDIAGAPPEAPSASPQVVMLVESDDATRRAIAGVLRGHGLAVEEYSRGRDFIEAVTFAVVGGNRPVLLIDLLLPDSSGGSGHGGFELLETVRARFANLPVALLAERKDEELERRAALVGASAVFVKPTRDDMREVRGPHALAALAVTIISRLLAGAGPDHTTVAQPVFHNIGAELLREMGEATDAPRIGKGPESPGLHLLRGMLQELGNPALGGGIILLVLRFASELMNRAVIFRVKEKEIVGLGQFGIEVSGEHADGRVRRISIPRDEESVFSSVLREMTPAKIKPGAGRWTDFLWEQLGGEQPAEIFLGPIISEGKVVSILYGDNLPAKKLIGDTEALEIFLSQAGLAMEKALLERRLRGREAD